MVFYEEQNINTKFKIIYLIITLFVFSTSVYQLYQKPNPDFEQWLGPSITIVLMLLVYFMIFNTPAHTKVNSTGIHYKYWPWIWNFKTIAWKDIERVEYLEINPLKDYGGYGIRFGGFKEKGIILNKGVALKIHINKDKKFTLTTRKINQLQKTVDYWMQDKMAYGKEKSFRS